MGSLDSSSRPEMRGPLLLGDGPLATWHRGVAPRGALGDVPVKKRKWLTIGLVALVNLAVFGMSPVAGIIMAIVAVCVVFTWR